MKLFNPLLITRIISTILIIETFAFIFCVPVALLYKESPSPFFWSAGITFLISTILYLISAKADSKKFSNRDGYLLVTFAWLVFLLFGALPYILSGTITSFSDAFFESCSGFTTTGSTIIPDVESLSHSILFWRSLTHWIGGLGIIALVIILLPSLRVAGYQLFTLESSIQEKIHPKTKAIGFRILFIYLGLTLAEIIFLSLGEMNLFESTCFSFGTVATGGFSIKNDSIVSYSAYSQYIIMLFMLMAGVSQVVYYHIIKFNFHKIRQNEELWSYLLIVIIAGATITSILLANTVMPLEQAFRSGFFQVISLITTTGFSSVDYLYWPGPAIIILFLLLFSGASTGSTTGSIKIARHLVVIRSIKSAFIRLVHPNAILNVRFNGKVVVEKTIISILSFVILYLFLFLIGTILVVTFGSDVVTASSAVAASLGNIGPGLAKVGPMLNYSHFPEATKIILSILMIVGRVEIIAVLSLFTRSFWKL